MKHKISDFLISEFSPRDYLEVVKKPRSLETRQKVFHLEKTVFGVYDELTRHFGGDSDIHFTFTTSKPPNPDSIRNLVKLLFSIYGCDSNGIAFEQTPVIGPFQDEVYCWFVDHGGNIVNEEDNILFGITFLNYEGEKSDLIIHEVQEVIEFQR